MSILSAAPFQGEVWFKLPCPCIMHVEGCILRGVVPEHKWQWPNISSLDMSCMEQLTNCSDSIIDAVPCPVCNGDEYKRGFCCACRGDGVL